MRREKAIRELAAARARATEAERVAHAGAPIGAAADAAAETPDEALLQSYVAAGEASARCAGAMAEERAARRASRQCEEDLHDVRFQIERLTANSVRVTTPLSEELDRARRQLAALDARREDLYRKPITVASGLPV